MQVENDQIDLTLREAGIELLSPTFIELELGHGFNHSLVCLNDLSIIIDSEGIADIDRDKVEVSMVVHDFTDKLGATEAELKNFLLRTGLDEEFVDDVLRITSTHGMKFEDVALSEEAQLVLVVDTINYADVNRFEEVAAFVDGIESQEKKEMTMEFLNEQYKERWLKVVVALSGPESSLSKLVDKYPSARSLYEDKMGVALNYLGEVRPDVFGYLYEEYHKAINL